MVFVSVSDRLVGTALRLGEHPAVVFRGKKLTFRELDEEASLLAAGLFRAKIGPGTRVAVMVPPSLEFFTLTFALMRLGAVPVLIDPGIGVKSLGVCLGEAEPDAFIGSAKAHLGRMLGGWAKGCLKTKIWAAPFSPGGLRLDDVRTMGAGLAPPPHKASADETAAILFTSGSTGPSKGAVYTHGMFSAQIELLRELFKVQDGEASVPTFPLFALFDAALGMTAAVPDMDATRPAEADPREIIARVRAASAVQLFGSPALLDRLSRYGEETGERLPTLKRVISAGAPVGVKVIERMAKMLSPEAEIFTPYGATEALPVALIGSREILGETMVGSAEGRGVCVGKPVPEMDARVIKITDEPISRWSDDLVVADGEVGELAVRGPVASPRYWGRPEATALAKIADGAGFWHRMGDLAYKDAKGRLWFCGRKSQRVITARGTLYTIPCEGVFNAHPKVKRTALVGARALGLVIPVLCVELEPGRVDQEAVKQELLNMGERVPLTKFIRTVLFHPKFPVDIRHNAKIFRERLADWATARIK